MSRPGSDPNDLRPLHHAQQLADVLWIDRALLARRSAEIAEREPDVAPNVPAVYLAALVELTTLPAHSPGQGAVDQCSGDEGGRG